MAPLSIAATALARIAARRANSNRFVRAGWAAAEVTLRSFARVAHLLWLQITGVFFLIFAVVGVIGFQREYHHYAAGKAGPGRAAVALCFALLFAWFGLSSFWRARKR
ncbi:MAG: hypothetical protein ACE14M_06930 [Terriglobales bacterium]